MTVHVTSWVLRNSRATLGSRLVLLVLADYADEDGGSCWPSVKTIARETLLSERQVQYALRNLEQLGEIAVEEKGGGRRSTRYRVCMVGAQNLHPSGVPRGAAHCTPEVQPTAPDPSVEPPEEQLLAAAPRPSDYKRITDAVRKSNEAMKKINPLPRARNPVWDALTEVFGEPTTPSAVKVRGKVCAGLTAARADPSEVVRRARTWPAHFDGATMTDLALEKHWDTLGRKPLRRER